ncbi:AAA family ATPase [Chitinophaga sp. GCM10012297]|uniref:AAA family ATPase n=1 Tax=Chitinophaga chungangae TaxID=2821488 RepID=A0ABS3YIG6_9BACT|nr:AAA family ATPase [Chitinophaga chungangae]MBO9154429.1 AAA family ATPase [Chitinophaga chungangae]
MIKSLSLNNVATYTEECIVSPTMVNYIFGANGSGKTTLAKVIADHTRWSSCRIEYTKRPIERLVYNKDFVNENFSQSSEVKGIFTLGKNSKEVQDAIKSLKSDLTNVEDDIGAVEKSIKKSESNLQEAYETAQGQAWRKKTQYDKYFKTAFTGFNGGKKTFFDKLISINPPTSQIDEKILIEKCEKLYNSALSIFNYLPNLDYTTLLNLSQKDILTRRVVGKEDIPFGKLINFLGNSDWVKKGLDYVPNDDICPFCQQDLNSDIIKNLQDFFNEDFRDSLEEITNIGKEYVKQSDILKGQFDSILSSNVSFLNYEAVTSKIALAKEQMEKNIASLRNKFNNPSQQVFLDSLSSVLNEIDDFINMSNKAIKENNDLLNNLIKAKENLVLEVWSFTRGLLSNELDVYFKARDIFEKANSKQQLRLVELKQKRKDLTIELHYKESQITSISHSVTEINKILTSFGFTGFHVAESENNGYYKIEREDGSAGKETLSEGEYNFLTFLYFFHLIKGNFESNGINTDRIVVIDDPVSSLDSSTLFVVSNLVKSVVREIKSQKSTIKQIFVLTHNVYFYKEITYLGSGKNNTKNESYWLIRKLENCSRIAMYEANPISTAYQLLWKELESPKTVNPITIFNTLRRILEYYFQVIGGINYEEVIHKFDGEDLLVCKTLLSWINDGSHSVYEDMILSNDVESIEKYLLVFKRIFVKLGHERHYCMMMKIEPSREKNELMEEDNDETKEELAKQALANVGS